MRGEDGAPSTSEEKGLARRTLLAAMVLGLGPVTTGCLNGPFGAGGTKTEGGASSPPDDESPDTSEMELAFEDTFSGDAIDSSKWQTKYPWDSRTHNHDGYAAPDNAYVEDDTLILKAEERPQNGMPYSTGVVSAKQVFQFGYFEGRIKVPPISHGFWPAFWLTSASEWPPEIDIFEFFGNGSELWMTYHYEGENGPEKVRDSWGNSNFDEEFHRYGVEWTPDRIVWYVDGVERFRYEGEYVKRERMWLILNFGISGVSFLDKPRSEDLPATYEVDWIRVWNR